MGKVPVPHAAGQTVECLFHTKARCWRRRIVLPRNRGGARTQAARDAAVHFDAHVRAGAISLAGFFGRVRDEAKRRVPLEGPMADGYSEVAP